jgi:hypothetical protein
MPLRVIETTDGKYLGLTLPIDPRQPPETVTAPDGAVFDPTAWDAIGSGRWRIRNAHYTVIAEEV